MTVSLPSPALKTLAPSGLPPSVAVRASATWFGGHRGQDVVADRAADVRAQVVGRVGHVPRGVVRAGEQRALVGRPGGLLGERRRRLEHPVGVRRIGREVQQRAGLHAPAVQPARHRRAVRARRAQHDPVLAVRDEAAVVGEVDDDDVVAVAAVDLVVAGRGDEGRVDDVGRVALEVRRPDEVVAGAAAQDVGAAAAREDVVARARVDLVAALAAEQQVVALAADHLVLAAAAEQDVVAGDALGEAVADEAVVAALAGDEVRAGAAEQAAAVDARAVVAVAAVDPVGARAAARDALVAVGHVQDVVPVAAVGAVVALAGVEDVVARPAVELRRRRARR